MKPRTAVDVGALLEDSRLDCAPVAFRKVADLALAGARGYQYKSFKIELEKLAIVRALTQAANGGRAA